MSASQNAADQFPLSMRKIVDLSHGCGLRMKELLNLRIKDIDFCHNKVYAWDSKSLKDRTIPLP
ncbi:MAG: tyrosine-type recombinase/integrase [Thiovulaceae bacterium]|nr:tyrosine-type recombinase/integrase [Sulfurimonadaceae bacterium]